MKTKQIEKTKEEINEILKDSGLSYFPTAYRGCEGFFIPANDNESRITYPGLSVTLCNKDIYKLYPHKILYIAIEDRKSVLYLTDRKIETHYSIEYWKDVLDEKSFAQPHYSYLVNLNYVEEVSKDFVLLRYGEEEYKVYTSSRKIGAFKKAMGEFFKNI